MCLAAGGFVLGEAIVLLNVTTGLILIPALFAAGLGVICRNKFLHGRRSGGAVWLSVFFLFVLFGMGRAGYDQRRWEERQSVCSGMAGKYVKVMGRLKAVEENGSTLQLTLEENQAAEARNQSGKTRRIPCILVSFQMPEEGDETLSAPDLKIGMELTVWGRLELFGKARNPGEFDSEGYYRALDADCRMFGEEMAAEGEAYSPFPEALRKLRKKAKENIVKSAKAEDAGIFSAAVLGDKKALDSKIKDLYQRNGIAHLLAISGLHLSIIGMGGYRLLRKIGLGYGGAGLAGAAFIAGYGMMTGGSPSVVRAVIMMTVGFLASYLGRTYDLVSAASLALFLLVWEIPARLTQGGVLLSFGAVFAVGIVLPVIEGWSGKGRWIFGAFAVSAAIQLVTLPVILWNFFQFPVYGIFLNLLVVPLMGGVICSGLGTALLGAYSGDAGAMAAGTGHYILKLYEWLCECAGRLPFHTLVLGRPEPAAVILYYAVLVAVLVWMKRGAENRRKARPGSSTGPSVWLKKAVILAVCTGMPCILIPRPVDGMEVLFLDVGQGDGILIRSGRSAILIDGGSSTEKKLGEYRLEPCLKSSGVSAVDYAFVSHGDMDHMSGVAYLLESSDEITIRNLVLPCLGKEDEALIRLAELAARRGTKVLYIEAGDRITLSGIGIECLYPGPDDIPADRNEESEVLKVEYGDCRILFTGDMSGNGEMQLLSALSDRPEVLSEIRILKAAHHGSRFSSEGAFLDALGVRWAVISYAEGNSYGHPHKEVLERLRERDVTIYETAEGGAITMKTDGKTVKWKRFVR